MAPPTDWADLRAPFPDSLLSKVDKGFGPIDTINHAVVTDRLLKVAPDFTYAIERFVDVEGKDGMPHLLAVWGWMRIGEVTRWEAGEVERPSTYGDELKKATSDFIKRAAMRFGVGLDLWSKEDLQSAGVPPESGRAETRGQQGPPADIPASSARTGARTESESHSDASIPAGQQPGPSSALAAPSGREPSPAVPNTGESTVDLIPVDGQAASRPAASPALSDAAAPFPASDESVSGGRPTGEGASLASPIAGPKEWATAARTLKTTQSNAQFLVMEFFKSARADVSKPSETTRDLLDWAVASIGFAKRASA